MQIIKEKRQFFKKTAHGFFFVLYVTCLIPQSCLYDNQGHQFLILHHSPLDCSPACPSDKNMCVIQHHRKDWQQSSWQHLTVGQQRTGMNTAQSVHTVHLHIREICAAKFNTSIFCIHILSHQKNGIPPARHEIPYK